METRQVLCPNCGCRLSYMLQPGIENKILVCPHCKNKAKVSEYPPYTPPTEEVLPPPPSKDDRGLLTIDDGSGATVLIDGPINHDPGQFHIRQTGQFCPLRRGRIVVGRLAKSKVADLQIGNDNYNDQYMSRLHIDLFVERASNGSLRHAVREHVDEKTGRTPGNGTKINGRPMTKGELAILNFGDVITLGQTELVLEHTDEEATQVIV